MKLTKLDFQKDSHSLILSKTGKTLKETDYFRKNKIYKLGQLLEEKSKEARNVPFDKKMVSLVNNLTLDIGTMEHGVIREDTVFLGNTKIVKMSQITQKDLYEDAILSKTREHFHQEKWITKLQIVILWDEVWNSVHNFLVSNAIRTAIWEQLHLNFYTQCTYNRWHSASDTCPLCGKLPEDIFHIILDCDFVNTVWDQVHPALSHLSTKILDDPEKALGIVRIKQTPGIMLRNWLGYKLREQILLFERRSYYHTNLPSVELFKAKFNQSVATDIKHMIYRFKNDGIIGKFDEVVAFKGILCEKKGQGEYRLKTVFK